MSKFQGSETSRVAVAIYPLDPLEIKEVGLKRRIGERTRQPNAIILQGPDTKDGEPVITSLHTSKALGTAAGTFSFDVKAGTKATVDMLRGINDDDWVDIVISRWGEKTHVMRGTVDAVRRRRRVNASGATEVVYTVTGRDSGKVFELTPIWFDFLTDGSLGAGAQARVFSTYDAFIGAPDITVNAILAGFLRDLNEVGRAHWTLPRTMPTFVGVPERFIDHLVFFQRDYVDYPARISPIAQNFHQPFNTSVMAHAAEFSDPLLNELYIDMIDAEGVESLIDPEEEKDREARTAAGQAHVAESTGFAVLKDGDYPKPQNDLIGQPVTSTHDDPVDNWVADHSTLTPAIIFRDRPFPTFTRKFAPELGGGDEPITSGPYFTRLRVYEVMPEHIIDEDVGKSGAERRNAFFASPQLVHQLSGGFFDFQHPLWDPNDMLLHGLRRMDVTTQYMIAPENFVEGVETYRKRLRDWHCLNHLYLSGSITLGHGRPDIRVGQRLRVVGDTDDSTDTYYIESVDHSWTLGSMRTTVGVTRGWTGTDSSLCAALEAATKNFPEAVRAATTPVVESITPALPVTPEAPQTPLPVVQSSVDRVMTYRAQLIQAAAAYSVPVAVLAGIMYTESRGRATAENRNKKNGQIVSVDYGLMQINSKAHAAWVTAWLAGTLPGYEGQIRDNTANIMKGAEVLATSRSALQSLLPELSGDSLLSAAIAGYNRGPGAVASNIRNGLSDEFGTARGNYRTTVLAAAARFEPLF